MTLLRMTVHVHYLAHNRLYVVLFSDTIFTQVTSVLLVIQPSLALFQRVQKHFGSWRNDSLIQNFDMDILNIEFGCKDQIPGPTKIVWNPGR